jgi:hypothetical protein
MNRILSQRDNMLTKGYLNSEDYELCGSSFNCFISNIIIVLVLSVAGCLCIGLPWYMFTVAGPVKAIAAIAIAVFVWIISGAILQGIFNSK